MVNYSLPMQEWGALVLLKMAPSRLRYCRYLHIKWNQYINTWECRIRIGRCTRVRVDQNRMLTETPKIQCIHQVQCLARDSTQTKTTSRPRLVESKLLLCRASANLRAHFATISFSSDVVDCSDVYTFWTFVSTEKNWLLVETLPFSFLHSSWCLILQKQKRQIIHDICQKRKS